MADTDNGYNPKPKFPQKPRPRRRKVYMPSDDVITRYQEIELQSADRNTRGANDTENALCGQLMLISTVFLTITVAVIANQESLATVSDLVKKLIVAGLLLLMASIAAGVIHYFKNIWFYRRWANTHTKNYERLGEPIDDWGKVTAQLNRKMAKLNATTDNTWLRVQIALMGMSVLAYAAAVIGILFNFGIR
ncbi:MAG TPA: hypothetical protein VLE73_05790 [Candidatus Saccharimonadales bacterium]|nr:hypothetical protein [Candidatus Saccharimonadales bacterium]